MVIARGGGSQRLRIWAGAQIYGPTSLINRATFNRQMNGCIPDPMPGMD